MQQTVKVRWWHWARYALLTTYDFLMGMFYMLACLFSFGLAFAVVYYLRIVAQ